MDPKLEGGQGETLSACVVTACGVSWVELQRGTLSSLNN